MINEIPFKRNGSDFPSVVWIVNFLGLVFVDRIETLSLKEMIE